MIQSVWRSEPPTLRGELSALLTEQASFTQALTAYVGAIQVRPINEQWTRARGEEASALQLLGVRQVFVREVVLEHEGHQWVFARSIIPAASLRGPNRELTQLGSKALGALLFSGEGRRVSLQFACLTGTSPLMHRLRALQLPITRGLPARRSLFEFRGKPLLVQEVFLPELMNRSRHAPVD